MISLEPSRSLLDLLFAARFCHIVIVGKLNLYSRLFEAMKPPNCLTG